MKARPLLPLLMFACLPLSGCPSYSVNPLYTDKDAVVEPNLEGTWISSDSSDKEEFVFQKSGDHKYNLAMVNPDTKVRQNFQVHLVRLGDQIFMDFMYENQTINGVKLDDPVVVIPAHVIAKVKISPDDLAYAGLEDDAIKSQSVSKGSPLDYQMAGGSLLITAQTDALRRYVSAHADDAFSKLEHLRRIK